MRSVESRKSRSKWTCARLTQAQQVKRQIKSARIIIGNSEDKRCEYTTFLGDQRTHITGIVQLLPPRAPKCHMLPNIPSFSAQIPRLFSSHCLMSNPVLQQTDPLFPMIDIKTEHFPHPEAHSRPLHGDARLDCGTFSQKLPNFFRKTGRNLQKVPHFLFHHSRHTFETAKKSRNSPTKS